MYTILRLIFTQNDVKESEKERDTEKYFLSYCSLLYNLQNPRKLFLLYTYMYFLCKRKILFKNANSSHFSSIFHLSEPDVKYMFIYSLCFQGHKKVNEQHWNIKKFTTNLFPFKALSLINSKVFVSVFGVIIRCEYFKILLRSFILDVYFIFKICVYFIKKVKIENKQNCQNMSPRKKTEFFLLLLFEYDNQESTKEGTFQSLIIE